MIPNLKFQLSSGNYQSNLTSVFYSWFESKVGQIILKIN